MELLKTIENYLIDNSEKIKIIGYLKTIELENILTDCFKKLHLLISEIENNDKEF